MQDWLAKLLVTLGLCALAVWGMVTAFHWVDVLIARQAGMLGP